ncbi:MAG: transposase, partial [Arcobacteraceae bacterium]
MLQYYMKCPYCNHSVTYKLKTGQEKCSRCKRKFSAQKIILEHKIINCFCEDKNIFETSQDLGTNYIT